MHHDSTQIDYLNATDKHWIGVQLSSGRHVRSMEISKAAQLTGLSQSQIMAIESGSQGPFANISHYVSSLRIYSQTLNTPESSEVLSWLDQLDGCSETASMPSIATQSVQLSQVLRIDKFFRNHLTGDLAEHGGTGRFGRLSSFGVSAALIALGFMITLPLMWSLNESEGGLADHQVAVQQAAVLVALHKEDSLTVEAQPVVPDLTQPVVTQPAAMESIEPVNQAPEKKLLGLKFSAPCWVQITTHDGQVTERLYEVAEVLNLDLQTTASLVVGNVVGTTAITQNGNLVDFNAFVAGGNVARLKEQDLVSLAYR